MALGLLLIRCDFFYRRIMRKKSYFRIFVTWTVILLVLLIIGFFKLMTTSNHPMAITKNYIYIEPLNSYFRRKSISKEMKDWNNIKLLVDEKFRSGPGEHGAKYFTPGEPTKEEEELFRMTGHNALVSDKISLDRAVPDLRSVECRKRLYRKDLPKVTVIIPFYDEHLSTLMRSVHSVINRSPPELLKEIVLVNDASSNNFLAEEIEAHIYHQKWGSKVKLLTMEERSGLIWSRLAGARVASGDVLLFLDCHIEAGHNYLPPLLDPIVDNFRAVVVPTLDIIDKMNYEIRSLGEGRTVFDWNFHAQRIPLRTDEHNRSSLFKTATMYGAAFAISTKYFWELQPDSGLKIYGGDQLEMSFKVNLCGGTLYETPCSRVAHIFRRFPYVKHQNGIDYKARNNKRVAEIWLDDYKQYFYSRHPERYRDLDIGDISQQLALKKKLNCKPFSYFLEHVAPDMLERFPLVELKHFASGTIRNIGLGKCMQAVDREHGAFIEVAQCSHNKTNPVQQQYFMLRHYRDIMLHGKSDCMEGTGHGVFYARCHFDQGNQYFRQDVDTQHLHWGRKLNNLCVDAHNETGRVYINYCDESKDTQKWVWGFSRISWLKNWTEYGAPINDKNEVLALLNLLPEVEETRPEQKVKEAQAGEIVIESYKAPEVFD